MKKAWLFLILASSGGTLWAAQPKTVELRAGVSRYLLDQQTYGRFGSPGPVPDEVRSGAAMEHPSGFNLGYHEGPVWIALRLTNRDHPDNRFYLRLLTAKTADGLFVVEGPRGPQRHVFGYRHTRRNQVNCCRTPEFPLDLARGETADIYIRVVNQQLINGAITLHTADSLRLEGETEQMFLGIHAGVLLGLILYNLFLFARLREPAFAYYIVFASSSLLLAEVAFGIMDLYVSLPGVYWGDYINALRTLPLITAVLFARNFLQTGTRLPRWDVLLLAFIAIQVVLLVLGLFHPSPRYLLAGDVSDRVAVVLLVTSGILSLRSGFTPARYFLLAWGVFMGHIVIWVLANANQLPLNFYTYYAPVIGVMFEMLLMSLAVADRMKIQEALAVQNQVQKQDNEILRTHLRVLCHDIRNPLMVIRGALTLMESGQKSMFMNCQNRALKGVDSIAALLNKASQLQSLQDGFIQIRLQPVSMQTAFSEVEFTFDDRLREKELSLLFSPADSENDIQVLADPLGLVHNVLNNLVSNAIKFSHRQGTIHLEAVADDELVHIFVRDEGTGMSPGIIRQLSNAGIKRSLPGTEKEAGRGFGLMIVRSFVREFGGRIRFENRSTGGTEVQITLRLAPDSSAVSGTEAMHQQD